VGIIPFKPKKISQKIGLTTAYWKGAGIYFGSPGVQKSS